MRPHRKVRVPKGSNKGQKSFLQVIVLCSPALECSPAESSNGGADLDNSQARGAVPLVIIRWLEKKTQSTNTSKSTFRSHELNCSLHSIHVPMDLEVTDSLLDLLVASCVSKHDSLTEDPML